MTAPARPGTLRRRVTALFAAVVMTAGLQSTVLASNASAAACSGVIVIGVRGTNESPGFGATVGPVVNQLMAKFNPYIAGSVWLSYPAADATYASSVRTGVAELTRYINSVLPSCPETKFILVGHSQGAHVIGDALAASRFNGSITGVALTGDPRFTPNVTGAISVNKLTGQSVRTQRQGGVFGKRGSLPTWTASKTRSLCLMTDSICDSPSAAVSLGMLWLNPNETHNKYMVTPGLGYGTLTGYLAAQMYTLANGAGGRA